MTVEILADGAELLFKSKYNQYALDDFKTRIPYSERSWDKANKVWRVAARHGQVLVDLARRWYGEDVRLPHVATQSAEETKILEVRYLGKAYERETGGERTANAWVDGGWNAVFPEQVLRKWFMDTIDDEATVQGPRPTKAQTLFGVLAVKQDATDDEIKKAYRRLAKQWHPDASREPGATQVFQAIQRAYEVLSDPKQRARYRAGLILQARAEQQAVAAQGSYRAARQIARAIEDIEAAYRSPLRCGWVMCKGSQQLGRFIVSEILAWNDIVDAQGRTLVSSWPNGADRHEEVWS